MVKFDTGNIVTLQTKPSLLCHQHRRQCNITANKTILIVSCYSSCKDVVKFDTGDNVILLQTKPSLLCHQHRGQCNITTNKAILTVSCYRSCNDVVKFDTGDNVPLLQTKPSLLFCVTGVVMMW